jgi:hypothetical protein
MHLVNDLIDLEINTKNVYVELQQFATVSLPQESAVFYPDGNSPGKYHGK